MTSPNIICKACENHFSPNLNLVAHGFDELIAPFSYEEPIRSLITDLKFNGKLKYAKLFGELLSQKIIQNGAPFPSLIIPVPLHSKRLKERGFNQTIEIGKIIGKNLKIPLDNESLIRIKNTQAQSDLKSEARQANVKNAFALNKKIAAHHVAILDDVLTTGATLRSVCETLKNNGVNKITIWCVARA